MQMCTNVVSPRQGKKGERQHGDAIGTCDGSRGVLVPLYEYEHAGLHTWLFKPFKGLKAPKAGNPRRAVLRLFISSAFIKHISVATGISKL